MRKDFDEYDAGVSGRSRTVWIVMVLAGLCFCGLGFFALRTGDSLPDHSDIVTLDSIDDPYKFEPEDKGGMDFPHQDKTIYDALDGNTARVQSETLYPDPQVPIMPEMTEEEPASDTVKKPDDTMITQENGAAESYVAPVPVNEKTQKLLQAKEKVKKLADAQQKILQQESDTSEATVAKKSAEVVVPSKAPKEVKKTVAPKIVEAKPVKQPPVMVGNFAVQLGAYTSQTEASAQWQKIYKNHLSVLNGTRNKIVRADLQGGTYYRLRAVGFASADAAKAACGKLSAGGQACFYAGQQ